MNIYTEQQARRHLIDLVRSVKSKLNLPLSPRYLGIQDPVAAHFELEVREAALELDEGEYIAERKLVVIDPRASDPDRLNFTFFVVVRLLLDFSAHSGGRCCRARWL